MSSRPISNTSGGSSDAAREKCVLVGVAAAGEDVADGEESLAELARLADTAGAETVGTVIQARDRPDPGTYIGRGKAAELATMTAALNAETIIFDDELKPGQQSKLQTITGAKVIDRTGLILDIFAQHAHSAEGKIQVELAQQRYRLTRLVGRGAELSRLGGGIGTRGPGEQKLEVDRRRIRNRIAHLERQLRSIDRTRSVKRKKRATSQVSQIALVGYTNAGKSTLMNRLTDSEVLVGDRLFSTLDPATSRLRLPSGRVAVLSDTVGFVRKLPHQLVEAFRSTLEEVVEADLLLHLTDASASSPADQIAAVREVIAEIGAADLPELIVANKTDIASRGGVARILEEEPGAIAISARSGDGVADLLEAIERLIAGDSRILELTIPYAEGALLDEIHTGCEVLGERHEAEATVITARVPQSQAGKFARFAVGT